MATFKKLLCCCAGGGDVTDLKRIARPHASAVASATKKADGTGEWKDFDGKDIKSVKMKADVDLDVDNRPDVVISHHADDNRISSPEPLISTASITVRDVKIDGFEPTDDDCKSLPDISDVVHVLPDAGRMKPAEEIVLETSQATGASTEVATAGLTLSIARPKSAVSVDMESSQEEHPSSPAKKRGSKGGRSLFQIKHRSATSPTTASSPLTPPATVDKVLLVKSKKKKGSRSGSSSGDESDSGGDK